MDLLNSYIFFSCARGINAPLPLILFYFFFFSRSYLLLRLLANSRTCVWNTHTHCSVSWSSLEELSKKKKKAQRVVARGRFHLHIFLFCFYAVPLSSLVCIYILLLPHHRQRRLRKSIQTFGQQYFSLSRLIFFFFHFLMVKLQNYHAHFKQSPWGQRERLSLCSSLTRYIAPPKNWRVIWLHLICENCNFKEFDSPGAMRARPPPRSFKLHLLYSTYIWCARRFIFTCILYFKITHVVYYYTIYI